MIRRGEIWWASLPTPTASEPGFRRPILVIQANSFNQSRIQTVVAVAITSNVKLAQAPGNVLLSAKGSGLPKPSVVNVSQIISLDKTFLEKRVKILAKRDLAMVEEGIRLVLSL